MSLFLEMQNVWEDVRRGRWRRIAEARRRQDYDLCIGAFTLRMPGGHHLREYAQEFRLYDQALNDIAGLCGAKYPNAWFLDVGANIGDSAARFLSSAENHVLCFEGCDAFLPYLRQNIERMGTTRITLEPSFVSGDCPVGNAIVSSGGTAHLEKIEEASKSAATVSLFECLQKYDVHDVALLKIDTDGMDFSILKASNAVLKKHQPVCLFEYDPLMMTDGAAQSIDTIDLLLLTGYTDFVVYDNLGNCMGLIAGGEAIKWFHALNHYLAQNMRYSGSHVDYCDVCAFHEKDADLARALYDIALER